MSPVSRAAACDSGPVELADALARIDKPRVLFRSYRDALRHLVSLMTPGVVVFSPISVAVMLSLVLVAGDSVMVVNGDIAMAGAPSGSLVAWSIIVFVITVAAQVVVFSATVILAAGHLLGRRVFPFAALRVAIRRWRALLVLIAFAVAVFVGIAVAGLWVAGATGELPLAIAVMIILGLAAVPSPLALPAILLEGRSAIGGIVRAHRVTSRHYWPTAFTLVIGVLVIPVAVTQGVRAWLPVRPALVVTGMVLPGLLYAATMTANPLGWVEVTETNVTESWTPSSLPGFSSGALLRPHDPRSPHALPDGRLVIHVDAAGLPPCC